MARRQQQLGRIQVLVLWLLGQRGAKSVNDLVDDWPHLTYASAYGAVQRLYTRKLVEFAGIDHYGHRSYCLTEAGGVVSDQLQYDLHEEEV